MRCSFAKWYSLAIAAVIYTFIAPGPAMLRAEIISKGETSARFAPLDKLMTRMIEEHQAPGAALAVARHGKVVYARGFGIADREAKEPVQPESLFRIASVSKPITGIAIMQLVEQEKLRLDDRVFTLLGLEEKVPPLGTLDERWKQITIQHLLQHTGGFDRDASFDPMFRSMNIAEEFGTVPPADTDLIIRYMLGRPLDFDPGTKFAYSNFGYCLLGRVIEKVTGESYEASVRKQVLEPLGITQMRLGKTLLADRAAGEVRYYDERNETGSAVVGKIGKIVPQPYGAWYLDAFDAHGGWLASAQDLAKILAALDDPETSPLLRAESIQTMFQPPPAPVSRKEDGSLNDSFYANGWMVRPTGDSFNAWHTGSIPGTSTLFVRRHDRMAWVVLFNTRGNHEGKVLSGIIDPLLHQAVNEIRWEE